MQTRTTKEVNEQGAPEAVAPSSLTDDILSAMEADRLYSIDELAAILGRHRNSVRSALELMSRRMNVLRIRIQEAPTDRPMIRFKRCQHDEDGFPIIAPDKLVENAMRYRILLEKVWLKVATVQTPEEAMERYCDQFMPTVSECDGAA